LRLGVENGTVEIKNKRSYGHALPRLGMMLYRTTGEKR
jgi:hypothetical protein